MPEEIKVSRIKTIISEEVDRQIDGLKDILVETIAEEVEEKLGEMKDVIDKRAIRGEKGDKGDSIIGPVGPVGPRGPKGESIIGKPGRDGRDGVDGKNGKDGSPDAPEQIKQKLIELPIKEEWFAVEHIKGLRDIVRNLVMALRQTTRTKGAGAGFGAVGGGGGGGGTAEEITITPPTGDGTTTAFTLGKNASSLQIFVNGQYQSSVRYTRSGTSITFLTAPPAASEIEAFGQP